jgi:hypothetical protein
MHHLINTIHQAASSGGDLNDSGCSFSNASKLSQSLEEFHYAFFSWTA